MITGSVQSKNNKWYVVLNLYDEDNKRKQKWISTGLPVPGNKRKAEKILRNKISEYENKKDICCSYSVSEYFTKWLENIKNEVRPNTYRSYHGNMTNHIIPYFGNQKILLCDLTTKNIEDYYRSRADYALSNTTIKHHHQNISKALNDAVRDGLISDNPARVARTPKQTQYKGEFLNQEQTKQMLMLFKGNVIELPVILCSVYGFRRSEVLGLKWGNVDFVNKTITISETLQQNTGGSYTDKTKTESSYRTLPMLGSVCELLKNQKQLQAERRSVMGAYYQVNDYVCTWQNGNVIEPNYLTRTFHSIIEKSTLPTIRLHDLRHSAASNLLAAGFSISQVQEWLGHESATTTMKYYAHVDKASKMAIAEDLEKVFVSF